MYETRITLTLLLLGGSVVALSGCLSTPEGAPLTPFSPPPLTVGNTTLLHRPGGLLNLSLIPKTLLPILLNATSLPYYTGFDGVEPTLGITKDGTIFLSASTFQSSTQVAPWTYVLKSDDKGQTWKPTGPTLPNGWPNPPASFDPWVYVDPSTDRVFTDDLEALACTYLSFSDDKGATWTTSPVACGNPVVVDHQSLVAAKPRATPTVGYPNIVYLCINHVYSTSCARSLDGGLVWHELPPAFLGVEGAELCGGLAGHLAASPDGVVFLPRGFCGVPMVAVTQDDGMTWERYVINSSVGMLEGTHEVRIAVDSNGTAYALWPDREGKMRLAHSKDQGKTWSAALVVSAPEVTFADFPAIAAADEGKVAIAYVGTTYPGGVKMNDRDHIGKDGTWNAYLAVIPQGATDPDPLIVTTRVNDPRDPIARGFCGGQRCPGIYDFIDVKIDSEGRPWASFVDSCVDKCAGPGAKPEESRSFHGFVAALSRGPALRGPNFSLPPLEPQKSPPTGKGEKGGGLPLLPGIDGIRP